MPKPSALPFSLLLALSFFSTSISSFAQSPNEVEFKVRGVINYEVNGYDGVQRHWTRDFTVAFKNCRWQIESVDASNDEQAIKSGGSGVIRTIVKVHKGGTNIVFNDYSEAIEDDDVPSSDTSGASFIWLAYASGCYLASVTNEQYKPVWLLDDRDLRKENYTVKGELELLNPLFPKELVYFSDGVIRARYQGQRVVVKPRGMPPGETRYVTNAVFRVLETTNVGNIDFARRFQFERFAVLPNYQTILVSKISGLIHEIELAVQAQELEPSLRGTAFVQDMRFEKSEPKVGEIRYRITNSTFLATNHPTVLREKKIGKLKTSTKARQEIDRANRPRIVLFLLALTTAAPVAYFLLTRRKNKSAKA